MTLVNVASKRRCIRSPMLKRLGQARVDVDHTGALQDTDAAGSKASGIGRRQSKGIEVEIVLGGLSGVWVSKAVWTCNGPTGGSLGHIGVRLVVGRRHGWREPLPGLRGRHRAEVPATNDGIQESRSGESLSLPERQFPGA